MSLRDSGGYSGLHAVQAPDTTTFSLDGVHPSNLGQALSANAFIAAMNDAFGLAIPQLTVASYAGQYQGSSITAPMLRALRSVPDQWR